MSAQARWKSAKMATAGHMVTRNFRTLREMGADAGVPFDALEFVAVLGEGAFGTVDKRRYTDKHGKTAYYAVKRLKKQDISMADPDGRDKAALARVLTKVSSRASRASISSQSGKPRPPNRNGSPEANRRESFTDIASPAAAESPPEEEEEEDVDALIAAMSEDDRMFMAEIGIMRKLSHPYIIRYLGCGIVTEKQPGGSPDKHFMAVAQECCDGGSLMSLMIRAAGSGLGKRLYSYPDALRWVTQAAKAIAYLHESHPQVLHRDLKSENLLLTHAGRGGDVRVMDFGLTKLRKIATVGYTQAIKSDVYMMTGETGSYIYMAPEVVRHEAYNEKVDIFSLGVITYELFMMCPLAIRVHKSGEPGEFPTYAKGVAAGYRETLKPSWPQELKDIISKCWDGNPDVRPSARDLVHLLTAASPAVEQMEAACKRGVVSAASGKPGAAASDGGGGCCVVS
eukprot:jgi/Ulvmu1/6751/UM030_0086.1